MRARWVVAGAIGAMGLLGATAAISSPAGLGDAPRAAARHVWSGDAPFAALPGESPVAATPDEAQALARELGVPVEDASQRTSDAEVFARPDGLWIGRQWLSDVWVATEGGEWELLDTTLETEADGTIAPASYPGELSFSSGDSTATAVATWRVPDSEVIVELIPVGGTLPEPVVEGSRVRYLDYQPGIDVVVDVNATGFEQYFVVDDADALAAPANPLRMEYRVAGGTARVVGEEIDIVDAEGVTVAVLPQAHAWDSTSDRRLSAPVLEEWAPDGSTDDRSDRTSGEPPVMVPVSTDVVLGEDGFTVALVLDEEWVTSDTTTFPLVIDPATHRVYASMDTYVYVKSPNSSYSSGTELLLGPAPGYSGSIYRPYLAFSTASMKPLDLDSATLYLWNQWSATCTQMPYHAYWTQTPSSSITWNTQPSHYGYYGTTYSTSGHDSSTLPYCSENWSTMDITAIAKLWQNQTSSSQGLFLTTGDEGNGATARWKRFWSSESSSSNKPHIDYVYNQLPNTPDSPTYTAATDTQRAQLSAKVSDPDGGTVRAAFTISRRPIGATTWEVMVDKAEGSAVSNNSYSVRAVDFIAGYEYQVAAWGYDGRRFSAASSAAITFTVTTTAGFGDVPATNDSHAAGVGEVLGVLEGALARREGGLR